MGRTKCLVKRQEAFAWRIEGLTYREISVKLGVSRQRVHQLIAPPTDVRDRIVAKYHGLCKECYLYVGKSGHIHHCSCNANEDYNDEANLELLCASCHRKAHRKVKPILPIGLSEGYMYDFPTPKESFVALRDAYNKVFA